jgi:hypothetical protein
VSLALSLICRIYILRSLWYFSFWSHWQLP